jgi:predicted CoA-binding protein
MNDPKIIDEMLRTAKTIAVVGMSDKTWRASHNIGRYLHENGYRVLPVNPALTEVLGLKSYPDLDAAQTAARAEGSSGIDLVDVSRTCGCRMEWCTTKPWPARKPPGSSACRTTVSSGNTPPGLPCTRSADSESL